MKRNANTNSNNNVLLTIIISLVLTVIMISAFGETAWAGEVEHEHVTKLTTGGNLETGEYYLEGDTEVSETIVIPEGNVVTICINDKKLTLNSSTDDVMFDVKGTLILTNCGNYQQEITFNYSGASSCYLAKVSGTLTLKNNVCLRVKSETTEVANMYNVYMCQDGAFLMENGFIGDDLTKTVAGYGIYLNKDIAPNGTLKLLGGTVAYCNTGVYTNKDITVGGTFRAENSAVDSNVYLDDGALINISDEVAPQKGNMKVAVSLSDGKGNITSETSCDYLRGLIISDTRNGDKENATGSKYDVFETVNGTSYTYSLVDAVREINFEKDPTLTYTGSDGKTKFWNSFDLLNTDCQVVAAREDLYVSIGMRGIVVKKLLLIRPVGNHAFNWNVNGTKVLYSGNIIGNCDEAMDIESIKSKYGFTDAKENDIVVGFIIKHVHGLEDTKEENDIVFQEFPSRGYFTGNPLSSGNYYLSGDLELDKNLVLEDNAVVNLCLAGNKIVYNDYTVEFNGGTFNIIEKCREEEEKKEKTPVIYFPYIPYTPLNTVTETEDNDKETTIEIPAGTKSDISDIEAEEASVKSTVSNLKIRANSKYVKSNGKRYIEVFSTVLSGKKKLAELKNLGYTVKYVVYRGTNEKNLKKIGESKTGKFTDKTGVNGKYYYYRIVLKIYDKEGKLIKSTKLDQCKYGSRMYNTNGLVH